MWGVRRHAQHCSCTARNQIAGAVLDASTPESLPGDPAADTEYHLSSAARLSKARQPPS